MKYKPQNTNLLCGQLYDQLVENLMFESQLHPHECYDLYSKMFHKLNDEISAELDTQLDCLL